MSKIKYINHNKEAFTKRNRLLVAYGYSSYEEYLRSDLWKKIKARYSKNPKFQSCLCCGGTKRIELHHIKYNKKMFKVGCAVIIRPLCRSCHEETHIISRDNNIRFKAAQKTLTKRINKQRNKKL